MKRWSTVRNFSLALYRCLRLITILVEVLEGASYVFQQVRVLSSVIVCTKFGWDFVSFFHNRAPSGKRGVGNIYEGPLRSYKQFLETQEDNITPTEAERRYEEYKVRFARLTIRWSRLLTMSLSEIMKCWIFLFIYCRTSTKCGKRGRFSMITNTKSGSKRDTILLTWKRNEKKKSTQLQTGSIEFRFCPDVLLHCFLFTTILSLCTTYEKSFIVISLFIFFCFF
jgi:hypothetical protein